MQPYPLKSLNFYKVNRDFTSDSEFKDCDIFKEGLIVQYQKSISNSHDMMEAIHFKDYNSNTELIWNTRVENLYDRGHEYLSPVSNPFL